MNPILIFTALGPILGIAGWLVSINWLLWVGVGLCGINLFMNLVSGVMKLPVLPVLFMVIGASLLSPWHLGVAAGLLAWTAWESAGEIITLLR